MQVAILGLTIRCREVREGDDRQECERVLASRQDLYMHHNNSNRNIRPGSSSGLELATVQHAPGSVVSIGVIQGSNADVIKIIDTSTDSVAISFQRPTENTRYRQFDGTGIPILHRFSAPVNQ